MISCYCFEMIEIADVDTIVDMGYKPLLQMTPDFMLIKPSPTTFARWTSPAGHSTGALSGAVLRCMVEN